MPYDRPRPVPSLFFLFAFGLCVGLGVWQIQRLQWKQGLIADIAAAKAMPPITIADKADSISLLPNDPAALAALNFHSFCIEGTWQGTPLRHKKLQPLEFHLVPRFFHNQMGYSIVSPFRFRDNHGDRTILVNRGWVPAAKKDFNKRPEMMVDDGKMTTVCGLLRTGAERSYFTPQNQPVKNLWFGRDVYDMAADGKLSFLVPAMLDVTGTQDATHLPVPSDGIVRVRNNHLGYIFTWFGIALGVLVIFVTYHHRKK